MEYGPIFRRIYADRKHCLWEALDFVNADEATLSWFSDLAHNAPPTSYNPAEFVVTVPDTAASRHWDAMVGEVMIAYDAADQIPY